MGAAGVAFGVESGDDADEVAAVSTGVEGSGEYDGRLTAMGGTVGVDEGCWRSADRNGHIEAVFGVLPLFLGDGAPGPAVLLLVLVLVLPVTSSDSSKCL